MGASLRILIIEDSDDDALLMVMQLRRSGFEPVYERVETPEATEDALSKQVWDAVICDCAMPHFSMPDALAIIKKLGLDLPFIIVSGTIGEEIAVTAMKLGAHDYIMKDNLTRLAPAISREMRDAEERRQRREAEEERARLVIAEQKARKEAEEASRVKDELDRFFMISLDMLCIANADGYFKRVSPAFTHTLGWSTGELLARPFIEFVHPDDRAATLHEVERQIAAGEPVLQFENRYRHKDGSWHVLSWKSAPQPGGFMFATARDVTEKKNAELALQEALLETAASQGRLHAMIQAVSSGLLVTDLNHRIVLVNHVAAGLLKVNAREAVGQTLDEAIKDKGLRERLRAALLRQETGAKFDFPGSAGKIVLCARTALVRDASGMITGNITVIEDVTREREVDRMKTDFLSAAAHELRTPLTSIRGFSEILLTRKMNEEKQRNFLETINAQATNLANIVNELLDLARIESGRGLELRRSATDVASIARELIGDFAARGDIHRYALEVKEQILAHCDRDKIRQVLQNLLSNAVKYSPKGGPVGVRLEQDEKFVTCSISDEGIGMSPEQLSHIFEKFYRADASNTAAEGTGLGMAIVKAIVEQHGGAIRIESELGRGTRAVFTLPRGITSGLSPAVAGDNVARQVKSGAKHILVLEDDPGAGSIMEFYLKEAGYNFKIVHRGAGFVDAAAQEQPDLICLDAILPDADGFDICAKLKKDPRTSAIPFIFVTVRDSERERGLALGARAYIAKPYDHKTLLAAIKAAIESKADYLERTART